MHSSKIMKELNEKKRLKYHEVMSNWSLFLELVLMHEINAENFCFNELFDERIILIVRIQSFVLLLNLC